MSKSASIKSRSFSYNQSVKQTRLRIKVIFLHIDGPSEHCPSQLIRINFTLTASYGSNSLRFITFQLSPFGTLSPPFTNTTLIKEKNIQKQTSNQIAKHPHCKNQT